jgi:cytochrome d ubiquinol oxidase subunit II
MMVLWLLILRGLAIELRSQQENLLWRDFWDTTFALASALLAVVLGAALGNVVRGVPLDGTGSFAIPLFTDFQPGAHPGIFDWYTTLVGVFTLCVLAGHGALYLVWKTSGPVQARSRASALMAWLVVVPLWALVTMATIRIQPTVVTNLFNRPWSLAFVLLMVGGLCGVIGFMKRELELAAFLSSSAFLLGLMAATMVGIYPLWLRSTLDPVHSLTAANAASENYALSVAIVWWTIGMILAAGYFVYVFRSFRGKLDARGEGYGH